MYSMWLQVFGEGKKKKTASVVLTMPWPLPVKRQAASSSGTAANQQMLSGFVCSTYLFQQVVSKEAAMLLDMPATQNITVLSL